MGRHIWNVDHPSLGRCSPTACCEKRIKDSRYLDPSQYQCKPLTEGSLLTGTHRNIGYRTKRYRKSAQIVNRVSEYGVPCHCMVAECCIVKQVCQDAADTYCNGLNVLLQYSIGRLVHTLLQKSSFCQNSHSPERPNESPDDKWRRGCRLKGKYRSWVRPLQPPIWSLINLPMVIYNLLWIPLAKWPRLRVITVVLFQAGYWKRSCWREMENLSWIHGPSRIDYHNALFRHCLWLMFPYWFWKKLWLRAFFSSGDTGLLLMGISLRWTDQRKDPWYLHRSP